MIQNARTSKILSGAKQHRLNVVGDFMKGHPACVALALVLGALVMTVGYGLSADVTTASHQAESPNASHR